MRQRKPFLLAFLVLAVLLGAASGAQATSNTWTSPSLDALGIFFLNSTGGATALYADNPATIQGGGTVFLGGTSSNNYVQGSTTTPAAGTTILGQGNIQAPLVNNGAVSVTGLGLTLSGSTINNEWTITPTGQLTFNSTTITNNNLIQNNSASGLNDPATLIGGNVTQARAGNATYFSASNALSILSNLVQGGTSSQNYVTGSTTTPPAGTTILGQGNIQAPLVNNGAVSATGSGLTLSGSTINNEWTITPGGQLTFNSTTISNNNLNNNLIQNNSASGLSDPATLNGGNVTQASAGNATYFSASNALSILSNLVQGGTSSQNYVTGSTTTPAAGTTILGQGNIQAPLVNNGAVSATGSGLTLSGSTINNEWTITPGGQLTFNSTTITNNNLIQNNSASGLSDPSYTWTSTSSGNWSHGSSWSPGGPPNGSGDTAAVTPFMATIYVDMNPVVNRLTVGATDGVVVNNGQQFSLGGTSPSLDVVGMFFLNSTGNATALSAVNPATIQGGGTVFLGGTSSNNYVQGSTITLAAGTTIQGQGNIQAPLVNNGAVTATGLGLTLSGSPIDNEGTMSANGGLLTFKNTSITNNGTINNNAFSDSGPNTVVFNNATISGNGKSSLIDPNGGQVQLNSSSLYDHQLGAGAVQIGGATSFYGKNTLNAGTSISVLNGQGLSFYNHGVSDPATLIGGNVTLASAGNATYFSAGNALSLQSNLVLGGTSSQNYVTGSTITLAAGYTIQGQGYIQAPLVNNGGVIAQDGNLTISGGITGNGIVTAQGGNLTISGGITGNSAVSLLGNATLNILSNLQVGNLNMSQFANLAVQNGQTVGISQDFTFAQQTPSSWNWGARTTLLMDGSGTPQSLEVGGKDYGYVPAGFSNNFNLQNLDINGAGTYVYLTGSVNNGQLGGSGGLAEALYVESLYIAAGDTLNLNGLHLYVDGFGLVGVGIWSNGGGLITGPMVPIPGTLLLLGSGLLGLAGFRRIRRS
jgi:hypothetical protein